jgi:hypothetical protein
MTVRGFILLPLLALLAALSVSTASAQASRSAQGDCAREASRRGFSVTSTRNFRQNSDGWSMDMTVRDSRGRVSEGSCYVETRSGDVSLYGFGWGNDGGSSNRFEFNCASTDRKYRECQLPVDGRARLTRQVSGAPCNEGRTWGQRGDRVWVDDGCRANFEVVRGGHGGGRDKVECRSQPGRYNECAIPRGYVGRLERDLSGGRCAQQGNWGNRDGLIWVRNGCQGRFEVVRGSNQGGNQGGGQGNSEQRRAEAQCGNEARRRGIDVQSVAPARWRSQYWETVVEGTSRGTRVRAGCRYFPQGNRTELDVRR